jgi:tetratricopeptide (TPR) repeat protein
MGFLKNLVKATVNSATDKKLKERPKYLLSSAAFLIGKQAESSINKQEMEQARDMLEKALINNSDPYFNDKMAFEGDDLVSVYKYLAKCSEYFGLSDQAFSHYAKALEQNPGKEDAEEIRKAMEKIKK